MNKWRQTFLNDIAIINPPESIKKGARAKKVSMELLQPFSKKVTGYTLEPYNSGMKFRNGDTIIARITPCLENGKTAYIDILEKDEVGFGSTEYIVLREKSDVSDKQFLYYFAISNEFRDVAILSMTGSSGRQRVELDVVKNHKFLLPPLFEQRAIALVLTSLDDKIDLLHRQNKTLEAMAESFFRKWFVEETEWNGTLSEYIKIQGGYAFKSSDFRDVGNNGILKITNISMGSIDIKKTQFVDDEIINGLDQIKFKINSGDFLIAMTGAEIGKIGIVEQTNKSLWLNQRVGKLIKNVPFGDLIGYLALKSLEGQDHIINTCSGSAQENISSSGIEAMEFVPYIKTNCDSFGEATIPLFDKIVHNKLQITILEKLRDTLLPKLMSGEVRLTL